MAAYFVPLTREEQLAEIRKKLTPEQQETLDRQLDLTELHAGDLLEIQCPTCYVSFEVYDLGDENTFICTDCGGQFVA